MKKYKFGFDLYALLLFSIIVIPNFIWFAIPAKIDILRSPYRTPIIDTIGSIFQILMLASLICLKRNYQFKNKPLLLLSSILFIILYYISWILYYLTFKQDRVIIALTICPCLAFMLFALYRKKCILHFFNFFHNLPYYVFIFEFLYFSSLDISP